MKPVPPLQLESESGEPAERPRTDLPQRPNTAFRELLGLLRQRCSVSAEDLVGALFAIRAHYSLDAIIPCCRHLDVLAGAFPEFTLEPAFSDQAARLQLIHEIGQLEVSRKSRLGAHRIRRKALLDHALHGWVGDSGVCDLLLVSRPWSHKAPDPAFERIQAWFAWGFYPDSVDTSK